jgi:hypothetical protein
MRGLQGALKLNICGLDPSMLISEVKDLHQLISTNIPQGLQYACRFWAVHLSHVDPCAELYQLLREIYLKHLLCWVEVMNLLGFKGEIPAIIRVAEDWISVCDYAFRSCEAH